MKLYDYWRSSSAWRVRIALHWKGIAYQRQAVNLLGPAGAPGDQHGDVFRERNPLGQVPVLELDAGDSDSEVHIDIDAGSGAGGGARERAGLRIAQSMAILEFLEERFPTPPLLPADPWRRARARQLAEMVNAGIQPLHNLATTEQVKTVLGGDPLAWIQHFVARGLTALERVAAETAGRFLVGDAVSIADVFLVPQLYVARRFSVAIDQFPSLLRSEASCSALPAFLAAHADRQPDRPPSPQT